MKHSFDSATTDASRPTTNALLLCIRLLTSAATVWLLSTGLLRAAEVGGTLTSDTVWALTDSPFVVTNTVTVPTNRTLTVEAGAQVHLAAGVSIRAQAGGRIEVAGTRDQPVRFRSLTDTNNWTRLEASGTTASLTMRHADVASGQTAALNGATGTFEFCRFGDYAPSSPILLSDQAAAVTVRGCHFTNYYETLFRRGVIVVEDSLFENVRGDALDFDYAAPGSVVRRCTFRHGALSNVDAVDLGSDSAGVLVEQCLMYDFPFDKGLSIGEASSNIVVRGCLIFGVDMGVAVKDSSAAVIVQNTIADSRLALSFYEKNTGQGGGHAVAWNNILWNHTNAIELLDDSTLDITFSDIGGTNDHPGVGNLNTNPLFLNALLADYRLPAGSPLATAGTNGTMLGAIFPVGSFLVDSDDDELPDTWEQTYGLNFNNPDDAENDLDGDGLSNRAEFWAGTDPRDLASRLVLEATALAANSTLVLSFEAISNRTYNIEQSPLLQASSWSNRWEFPPTSGNRLVQVTNATDGGDAGLFRLRVSP